MLAIRGLLGRFAARRLRRHQRIFASCHPNAVSGTSKRRATSAVDILDPSTTGSRSETASKVLRELVGFSFGRIGVAVNGPISKNISLRVQEDMRELMRCCETLFGV